MFIHTLESLEEFEDYIEQLEETVGLNTETYKEVKTAINKERTKLKKLIIADVSKSFYCFNKIATDNINVCDKQCGNCKNGKQ